MSQTVEDVRHRIKRLHECGPNHEAFKIGDMDAEFMLAEYDKLNARLQALAAQSGEFDEEQSLKDWAASYLDEGSRSVDSFMIGQRLKHQEMSAIISARESDLEDMTNDRNDLQRYLNAVKRDREALLAEKDRRIAELEAALKMYSSEVMRIGATISPRHADKALQRGGKRE